MIYALTECGRFQNDHARFAGADRETGKTLINCDEDVELKREYGKYIKIKIN